MSWSNQVSLAIGLDFDASYQAELILSMSVTQYLSIFMDQIFTSVSVILSGLGAMLIYSLLIADINEKTFEYGMLRALGLRNSSLIVILTTQAIFYAVPGILLGILLSFVAFVPLANLLGDYAATPPDYSFDHGALVLAVLMGFFLPILANIIPIQRVLSRTLRDALDIFYTGDSTSVSFIRLDTESFDFSGPQTSAALLMSIFGFVIYYVVPYAFVALKTGLFLGIMNWILLGMVFGCIILSTTAQPHLERLILFCSMWGTERTKLSDLVKKSLSGHRVRNRKTALMFTISLAFVIFAGAMFALQTRALNSNIELLLGAHMVVFAPRSQNALNEPAFREFFASQAALQAQKQEPATVLGYSFMTFPVTSSSLSDLAGITSQSAILYGLEDNYLASTYSKFYLPSAMSDQFSYAIDPSSSKPDLIDSLSRFRRQQRLPDEVFINASSLLLPTSILTDFPPTNFSQDAFDSSTRLFLGFLEVLASEAVRPSYKLSTSLPGNLRSSGNQFFLKFRGFLQKLPGFLYSSYPQASYGAPLILSMDSHRQVVEKVSPSLQHQSPHYQRLLLRLRNDMTALDRAAVINGLRTCINDSFTQVVDTTDILEGSANATALILVFFNVISLIAILMCFFSLWLSFIANVNENAWEFGVLRAVGLTAAQVVRLYLYEAFALILSAVIISTLLGVAIATTLTLQFDVFTEMAFEFSFPSFLFFSVSTLSVIVSFGGSYLASRDLGNKPIAAALKGL
ncbi:MAG: ABC transporter permease [archaeon]|nr:ABC transporter permease [archaeon]